jgi:restriction system protein
LAESDRWLLLLGSLVGGIIAAQIAVWLGLVAAPVLLLVAGNVMESNRKRQYAEWLQTGEGLAWQRAEQENLRVAEEAAARKRWNAYFESKTMDDVSRMPGREFEEFLKRLLSRMGYTKITLTPANDQGADITCVSPDGESIAIQAKRWQSAVGNSAVQEVYSAKGYYRCTHAWVITNTTFTLAARELAKSNSVTLLDGRWLEAQVKKFLLTQIPEFDWAEYNRTVKHWESSRIAPEQWRAQRSMLRNAIARYEGLIKFKTAKGSQLTDQQRAQISDLQEKIAVLRRERDQGEGKLPA